MEQRAPGTMRVWSEPFTNSAGPENLQPPNRPVRARGHHFEHLLRLAIWTTPFNSFPRKTYVGEFLMTFKDYPQRQKAASFNMDEVLAKLRESSSK